MSDINEYKLIKEIIARSEANTWEQAQPQWKVKDSYTVEIPDTCLCGHSPIKEIYILQNLRNGLKAKIGNECVKRFLGPTLNRIFQSLKRLGADVEKSLNIDTIEWLYSHRWIKTWEYGFYCSILRKHNLTYYQYVKKQEINKKIWNRFINSRSSVLCAGS